MMMNTKKLEDILLTGFLIVFAFVVTQASSVFASQSVFDEIEQSVPVEEIKSIDNQVQRDLINPKNEINSVEQIYTPDNPKIEDELNNVLTPSSTNDSGEQAVSSEDTELSEDNQEDTADNKILSNDYGTKNLENSLKLESDNAKKTCFVLSDFLTKHSWLVQKLHLKGFFEYLASCRLFKNSNLYAQNTTDKKQTNNLDFLPYYFIYPTFHKDCLEKAYLSGKVSDISEFLPYSLSIKCTTPKIDLPKSMVTPQGTTDIMVLINAPSPKIVVTGKSLFAKLVVDIRNNTLYKYDKNGMPLKAYLVATGASGTRTLPGLRVVTYKESFPYAGDPTSKRALDPYSYGPYIIFVNVVDPKTGRQYVIEQLLHGNGNEYSIGKKVSHGCVRTNNNVMKKELSKEVKRGDYILLINPDIG